MVQSIDLRRRDAVNKPRRRRALSGRGNHLPEVGWRHPLRSAARTLGLEPDRESKVKPYDFRHSVATELTERSGNLPGLTIGGPDRLS